MTDLIRLSNPTGTLLLMLPSLWALVVASKGTPSPRLVAIFVVGAFLMRSAGVVLNDLADRSIDSQVERTKYRPLANGTLTIPIALAIGGVLISLAASLLILLNPLTAMLAPVALLLAAIYPFTKRIFPLPQAILGIAFGWGSVMAWAAVKNSLDSPVWFIFIATIFWAIAYDTIYAIQDREDDIRIGVKSSAILFGSWAWLAVAGCSFFMLASLLWCGKLIGVNPLFLAIVAGVGGFLGYQAGWLRLDISPAQAFTMFKQHVWVGVAILIGFWWGLR